MRATFVNIAKSSTYDYTKVFMMADNVHIENDKEGSVDESEEEDSDIEDDELEVHELDKDIFERLEKNDPAVAILSIDLNCNNDKSFFNSIDWKVDGGCIANNTHIKRLNIHIVAPGENYILGGQGNELPTRQQLQDFFSCIYRNKFITDIAITLIRIVTEFGGRLIEGLQGHRSLEKLEIKYGELGSIGCEALGKVLKQPRSKVKDLRLYNCELDDEAIGIVCNGLLGKS